MTNLQLVGLLLFAFLYLFPDALITWRTQAAAKDWRVIEIYRLIVLGFGSVACAAFFGTLLTEPALAGRVIMGPDWVAWLPWFLAAFDALVVVDLAVKAAKRLTHTVSQP